MTMIVAEIERVDFEGRTLHVNLPTPGILTLPYDLDLFDVDRAIDDYNRILNNRHGLHESRVDLDSSGLTVVNTGAHTRFHPSVYLGHIIDGVVPFGGGGEAEDHDKRFHEERVKEISPTTQEYIRMYAKIATIKAMGDENSPAIVGAAERVDSYLAEFEYEHFISMSDIVGGVVTALTRNKTMPSGFMNRVFIYFVSQQLSYENSVRQITT